ncbi:Holo-[acyl-carrier-protein] synthase [Georgfuchsia toluolica]|uniref:Holo-[acyl-carrier-protein] synthase n=1 Tax=Georgfuchsia toluolica TaxID=424218 RepID=A0A916J4P0_9PROT|nr:holo-ACP synthase [Georgfuchsia toluolica]CAG4883835.1 Holo-[acyl-carrier-protein] synthase [Georgfuchsia toluolica]
MIFGVGTDIAQISRLGDLYQRQGERTLEKILTPSERAACKASADPARFLAKRFAAKEALGKAYGTGVRAPVLLPNIAIEHDELGKPFFVFSAPLAAVFAERGLIAHLSISDEREFVVAFVILEQP